MRLTAFLSYWQLLHPRRSGAEAIWNAEADDGYDEGRVR